MTMTPHEELNATIDAARDQENRLNQQADEFEIILDELRKELDSIKHARRQYEADLYEMQPLVNALRKGARIEVTYPETIPNLTDIYYTPPRVTAPTTYTPPPGYGIHP